MYVNICIPETRLHYVSLWYMELCWLNNSNSIITATIHLLVQLLLSGHILKSLSAKFYSSKSILLLNSDLM